MSSALHCIHVTATEKIVDLRMAEQCRLFEQKLVEDGAKMVASHFETSASQLLSSNEVWNCATAIGWDNLRRSRGDEIILVCDDETVVGFALFATTSNILESYPVEELPGLIGRVISIDVLYVHPKYRRQGICTVLFDHIKDIAHSRKVTFLLLQNDSSNRVADRLYSKFGFRFLEGSLVWTPSYFTAWSSKLGHYPSSEYDQHTRRVFELSLQEQSAYDSRLCEFVTKDVIPEQVERTRKLPMFNWNNGQIVGTVKPGAKISRACLLASLHISRTLLLTKKINVLKAGLTDIVNWAHKELNYDHFEISTVDEDLCDMLTKLRFDLYYKTRILRI